MEKIPELSQTLRGWQIFFIVIGGIYGGANFFNIGEALEVAGPAGLLTATIVLSIITMCVGECLSEFGQLFPAPNALVEYVKYFVDEDLAWVVGLAYWYCYASIFSAQILTAADHSSYWGLHKTTQTMLFDVVAPIVIFGINACGVFLYGVIETMFGILKLCLVLGCCFLMFAISAENHDGNTRPIHDGFQNKEPFARTPARAVCFVIPVVAYGFLGVEIVAVTAYEAYRPESTKRSSQILPLVVCVLNIVSGIADCLNVKWTNPDLLSIIWSPSKGSTTIAGNSTPRSSSVMIIAASNAGLKNIPGFLNGCFIFSVLSAANTSLYVSSRTLYGLARDSNEASKLGRLFYNLTWVETRTRVPLAAVIVSILAFFWLPFLHLLKRAYADAELIEIVATSSLVSGIFVWASICLAYIRYIQWLDKCTPDTRKMLPELDRQRPQYQHKTLLGKLQPAAAYLGLVGCVVILAFVSAAWWDDRATFAKVAIGYGPLIILFSIWSGFKIVYRRKPVLMSDDIRPLFKAIKSLQWVKRPMETSDGKDTNPIELLTRRIRKEPARPASAHCAPHSMQMDGRIESV